MSTVVFASGRGSNVAALLAAQKAGTLPIRIRAVLSDKSKAGALDIARDTGIAAVSLAPREFADRRAFDQALFDRAAAFSPELIVLAGYMRIIDGNVVAPWHGRIINIHPSLLPRYPGLHTHRRALESGDRVHGASVHFVTAQLDGGPVIARVELPVLADDTPDSLAARLLPLEHRLLIASVDLIVRRRVALEASGVVVDGRLLTAPLQLRADDTLV
ncbi:MAG: phosphoribosylglycinamide formyltransferase [Rudaea sp.]